VAIGEAALKQGPLDGGQCEESWSQSDRVTIVDQAAVAGAAGTMDM
jgi:hypothetical protein